MELSELAKIIISVAGGIAVIICTAYTTVKGLNKQPQEQVKVESESLGGAVEALNRLADVGEDLRDMFKAQFERQAHDSEIQQIMLAFESRLAAVAKKPPRSRAAPKRKTDG